MCAGDQRLRVRNGVDNVDDLCVSLSQPCVCAGHWKLHSTKQVSSLLRTSYKCMS